MEQIFETVYPDYKEFIEKEKSMVQFRNNMRNELLSGNKIRFYIQTFDKNIFYSRMTSFMLDSTKCYRVELKFNNKYYIIDGVGTSHKGDWKKQIFFENITRIRLGYEYRNYIELENGYISILFSEILKLMSENQNYDEKYTKKLINDDFFKKNHQEICYFFKKNNKSLFLDRIINVFKDFLLIHQYDNFKLQLIQKDIELEEKNNEKFNLIFKQLDDLKTQLCQKDTELDDLKTQLCQKDTELDDLKTQLRQKDAELEEKNKILKKLLTTL